MLFASGGSPNKALYSSEGFSGQWVGCAMAGATVGQNHLSGKGASERVDPIKGEGGVIVWKQRLLCASYEAGCWLGRGLDQRANEEGCQIRH